MTVAETVAEYVVKSGAAFEAARLAHLAKTPPSVSSPERRLYAVESIWAGLVAEHNALEEMPISVPAGAYREHLGRLLGRIETHKKLMAKMRAKLEPEIAQIRAGHDLARANAERGLEKVLEDWRAEVARHAQAAPSDREDSRHERAMSSIKARAAGAKRALSFLPAALDAVEGE